MDVLRQGAGAEVLAPDELRGEVSQELRLAVSHYAPRDAT